MISERLRLIQEKIKQSCLKSGRKIDEITLVAITKNVDYPNILTASELGITLFGESRIQEAENKISRLPKNLLWHMIGHLQSNKIQKALQLFQLLQSVDSLRLAQRIHTIAEGLHQKIDILVQVNIGAEETKFGFRESEIENIVSEILKLSHLNIRGLMTIAPFYEDLELVRPYFKKMKKIFNRFKNMDILSMGMSHDFTTAIEEGSTMIRIGQALFGERK